MSQANDRSGQRQGRRLTPEQRRRILEMRRRQRRRKQLMIAIPAALAVIVAALCLTLVLKSRGGSAGDSTEEVVASAALVDSESVGVEATVDSAASVEPTEEPTPEPTVNPVDYEPEGGVFVFDDAYAAAARGAVTGPLIEADLSNVDSEKLSRWPKITEGYMPTVYRAKDVTEKIIAVTVDDCFQAGNLRQIVQCALDNNAQLTIFPIGDNLAKEKIGAAVKWAWEVGMEIENHTYNHVGMYHYKDARMEKEIWSQNAILNQVLGVNYEEHFFRPKGGDERNDQRVHAYVNQLGFSAIAMWSTSGSGNGIQKIVESLAPGEIYLFHTTDKDLQKLLYFIPYAVQQGYRLVTLNEMFGLPDNATSELTEAGEAPALEPFKILPATLQKTTYVRAAAVIQKRLKELGWLTGKVDGVFGESSYVATGNFQKAAGIKADGTAGPATQIAMFADDAPRKKK